MKSILEKERLAESEFQAYLDKHNIPYWYIDQKIGTFSTALKQSMTRRPDFIILIPGMGLILTDVEYKRSAVKYPEFQINAEETHKYCNVQEQHGLHIWYVFSCEHSHFNTWYWIQVDKVKNEGKLWSKDDKRFSYYSVFIDKCIQISTTESLGKLFENAFKKV